jgi:START domain
MNRFLRYGTITILVLLRAQLAAGQLDCVLKKEKDNLRVYSCPSKKTNLNTIKTELILEGVTLDRLYEFLWDVENYVNWQYNTIETSILKKKSSSSMIYRTVVEAPWPLSNRELFTEIESDYDRIGKTLKIITRNVDYEFPDNEDLVRVPFSVGVWDAAILHNSTLKIVYTLTIDPGGSVPSWLLNMAIAEGPFVSFTNLKESLTKNSRP